MPDNKKRILVCIDWYEPGFKAGGPIRSVVNMVNALKLEFEFYILTTAYDLGEDAPYPGIEINQWHDLNGIFVKYMDHGAMTGSSIKGNIHEIAPDILYLNSLFSKLFTIAPLLVAKRKRVRVILAPRGMLGSEALGLKRRKKRLFLWFAKIIGLYRTVIWHASTALEEKEIHSVFGIKANVKIAQNIPIIQALNLDEILNKKNTGLVRFLYVSRIIENKNLLLAINALKNVHSSGEIQFHIYGNIEDPNYFAFCEKEFVNNERLKIEYKGILRPGEVSSVLVDGDFMILPTRFENYGHAIVEAWANGCPVIISKNTPWKNLHVQQLGWDVDISDPKNLVDAIQEGIDIDFTSYIAMVRASYQYFAEKICDDAVMNANRKLFES
jgi:glycosyltransferase involved in cell wall biosynthesis